MEYVTVNEKMTTWVRHIFQVDNVTSKQEAIDKVVEVYKKDYDPAYDDKDIEIVDSIEMCDCEESMSVKENGGYATIEVMNENNKVIWDNGEIR